MSIVKDIGDLLIEGIKIHSSDDVAQKIVVTVKGQLKENYPKFLSDTDLGKAIAPILIPMLVYAIAKQSESNPTMKKAAIVADYAIKGASRGLVDYANQLLPLFSSIAALSILIDDS